MAWLDALLRLRIKYKLRRLVTVRKKNILIDNKKIYPYFSEYNVQFIFITLSFIYQYVEWYLDIARPKINHWQNVIDILCTYMLIILLYCLILPHNE